MRGCFARWLTVAARLSVVVALVCLGEDALAQRYGVTRYATVDGLPAVRVTALLQDRTGFLWFGTTGGLSRYDGTSFERSELSAILEGMAVADLAEDPERGVLVATRSGGLGFIGPVRSRLVLGPGLDGRGIRDLERDPRGTIWVALDGGAARIDPGASPAEVPTDGLSGCCLTVLGDRRGRIWAGTSRGLARLQPGGPELLADALPGDPAVRVLVEDDSGTLWVGTSEGLFRESAGRLVRESTPLGDDVAVLAAARAPDGSLWFGAEAGALHYAGSWDRVLTAANGLPDDRVNDVLVDREGSVWFATDGGAAKLVGSEFATVDSAHGLRDDFVVAAAVDDRGRAWIATRDGLARVASDGRVELSVGTRESIAGSLSALSVGGGRRIVGTTRGQLYDLDEGELRRLPTTGLPGTEISALLVEDARLWAGGEDGLFVAADDGDFRPVGVVGSGSPVAVTDLVRDGSGALWVGTAESGVYRGRGGEFEPVAPELFQGTTVWDLAADPGGGIWVATNGRGVVGLVGERTIRLTRAGSGLASDIVQQVVPAGDRGLWIYTSEGLDRWDPVRGVSHYDLGSGLADLSGNPGAGVTDRGGTLWMGTPSGLTMHRAELGSSVRQTEAPRVLIREVRVDGRSLPPDGPLTLEAGTREVVFAYSALSYRDEAGTRFRYRLRGYSTEWAPPTERRQVAYVGLPPGEYVFEVQAINAAGLWSQEPATVAVSLQPTLWQTLWFRGALAVVALLVVGWLFRSRLRRVESERERLREIVDRRTHELVEKNTLLERMATTDELTGLPNRRFFLESMERELRKLSRMPTDQPLSLLVIDLDRFKRINDEHGHAAGDEVLRQVSRLLARTVRATDLPARYGGEEFAILLPNTDLEGARYLGEKLRSEVEAMSLSYGGRSIPVTISVGAATIESADRYDSSLGDRLMQRADEAMYRAKESGRNRVVADEASPLTPAGSAPPS